MSKIENCAKILEKDDWEILELGKKTLHALFHAKDGDYHVIIDTEKKQKQVTVIASKSGLVPEAFRSRAQEFLNRVNLDCSTTNFAIDFSDGGLSCCTNWDLNIDKFSLLAFRMVIILTHGLFQKICSFIQKLITENKSVDDLYEEWKSKESESDKKG